jgi:hypothetical protein
LGGPGFLNVLHVRQRRSNACLPRVRLVGNNARIECGLPLACRHKRNSKITLMRGKLRGYGVWNAVVDQIEI